jgi:glutamyl-Q tRNA(Asp) synthetase
VKSSTATATTATADRRAPYRGRFAPSPTGPLHTGSLVAALASWLDARARDGIWLVRIEDLDAPRCVPGGAEDILATLAQFGLESDEPVLWQSHRHAAYEAALEQLASAGRAYRCRCARSDVTGPYPGTCRDLHLIDPGTAWRLRLDTGAQITFCDAIQGPRCYPTSGLGDPIIFRRDRIAAYQLAVVVDDAFQQITHVVRGADLLESTGWQIAIFQALGAPVPEYAHVPLITEPDGSKLAKSRRSVPIAALDVQDTLYEALRLLALPVFADLKAAAVSDMLSWAVRHWEARRLQGVTALPLGR